MLSIQLPQKRSAANARICYGNVRPFCFIAMPWMISPSAGLSGMIPPGT
jgi:hypothetical protein